MARRTASCAPLVVAFILASVAGTGCAPSRARDADTTSARPARPMSSAAAPGGAADRKRFEAEIGAVELAIDAAELLIIAEKRKISARIVTTSSEWLGTGRTRLREAREFFGNNRRDMALNRMYGASAAAEDSRLLVRTASGGTPVGKRHVDERAEAAVFVRVAARRYKEATMLYLRQEAEEAVRPLFAMLESGEKLFQEARMHWVNGQFHNAVESANRALPVLTDTGASLYANLRVHRPAVPPPASPHRMNEVTWDAAVDLIRTCKVISALQGLLGLFGHVSAYSSERQRVFICPGAGSDKATTTPANVHVLDLEGRLLDGQGHVAIEWPIHTTLHAARPDALAVAHLHAPYATLFAIARREFRPVTLHGSLFGEGVPCTPSPSSSRPWRRAGDSST